MTKIYTAAMIVIGNEILSGRTQDLNINYAASKLVGVGVSLSQVRIVPDVAEDIIFAVNELRARVDYVFTSGGIGPTHDDITAQCIADAFGVALVDNGEARGLLGAHYGGDDLSDARLRMAKIPVGAALIPNPVSAAPGFIIENVHVMAGVPRIMQAMIDHVCSTIKGGDIVKSRSIPCGHTESKISAALADIQNAHSTVDIGSYPYFKDGKLGVNIVLRSSDVAELERVEAVVIAMVDAI